MEKERDINMPTPKASPHSSPSPPSQNKRRQSNMSLSQTYFLAQVARQKLLHAARQADRDLRVLTAHANLLDSLMAELSEAENEQEHWFNQSVSCANASNDIQVTHREDPPSGFDFDSEDEDDYEDDECDSDCSCSSGSSSGSGEDVVFVLDVHNRASRIKPPFTSLYDDMDEDEDEETDYLHYTRDDIQQPPELLQDPDDESDDECQPPSPKRNSFDYFAASSSTPGKILTSSVIGKRAEVAQDDDNDDMPLLGYCFSPSSVLLG
ncbi:conserved hypothetical protein [Microsporum canis CBS 113480]|uniref:Uncharacterized protein n=1 Tax=Arthroderma otae (strain ATCC MYA-4605 / CBS 113480) TaxID=554155 RepID=C5FQ14_ARTOC|nr:conserved hypothetical protein [Microsporum canis CBS 113480]EEQ31967.1 conserved hypothetical protein [Microsporum canis CBS 113480]